MVKQVYGAFRGRELVREHRLLWKLTVGKYGWNSEGRDRSCHTEEAGAGSPGMAFSFKSLKALLGSQRPSPGTAYKQARLAV